MGERLSLSGLWTDTLASYRAHAGIFLTLAAAFLFLPQLVGGMVMQAAGVEFTLQEIMRGARPPGWLFPVNLVIALLQLLCVIPVVRVVLGLAGPNETVGQMIGDAVARLPRFLAALLWLFLLYFGVLLLLILPLAAIGAVTGELAPAAARTPGGAAYTAAVLFVGVVMGVLLVLIARFSVWLTVFVVENPGARATATRAWALIRGHTGRILLIFVAIILGILLASLALGALGAALGVVGRVLGSAAVGNFLLLLVNAALGAAISLLLYIFSAHLYRRLRGMEPIR